ncbi:MULTISPECIES: hypothetical protein [unclassified Streptomyces]|uniref:Transposase n=1 Tax=Streptomyces sp. NBC_00119 TaxID=2975659 RepID=A0AAU1TWW4_9ACTN|nr:MULTISPECIES: hypothetical protein [unclassified Streptomyces]MCX4648136.1 hypothetical protein [Streptomyces sp. NBC_01446]MCX5323743.1 hypothetical protein [Streptomyces sp. NBC_00120]
MDASSTLRILNVDPRQLPPAPATTSGAEAFARISHTPQPCVACGRPATTTRIVEVPQTGSRWIDTCTPHMIATTKTAATRAPESQVLASLRDAVRHAGIEAALLTAPLTEAECSRG